MEQDWMFRSCSPVQRRRTIMKRSTAFASLLAFTLGATAAEATNLLVADPLEDVPLTTDRPIPGPQHPTAEYSPTQSLAPLVEALQPAVVNIHVEQKVPNDMMPMLDFFSPFFGHPQQGQQMPEYRVKTGQGSGFLISADGYLLTNNHVVADADKVTVRLSDDQEYEGTVVGTDSRIDIALVKIEADEDLPYVAAGKSDGMKVGDWVVAIGNPFGLSHTVTAGIVSAKGRVIGAGPYDDFIQTDASINPGNSGGPLFNLAGEVIGINTAINAAGQGIGFAVPIDMVTPFLDDLKAHGEIARGWLGVSVQDLDEELAAGLKIDTKTGVLLSEVYANQPGEKAGLHTGDIVQHINGTAITDSKALIRAIGRYRAGETVDIDLVRDGKKKSVKAPLGKRPSEKAIRTARYEPGSVNRGPSNAPILKKLGFGITAAPDGSVVINRVDPDLPAHGRLKIGDRILEANGERIGSTAQLANALHQRGKHIVLVVKRDRRRIYVALPRP
jgi:serine protease Do